MTEPQEFQKALQAVTALGELEPVTAWDVDAPLLGWMRVVSELYASTVKYTANLQDVRIDRRVVSAFRSTTGDLRDVYFHLDNVRSTYREVYRALFEIAESGTSVPDKPGFWDSKST